jgi:hypothetical protein
VAAHEIMIGTPAIRNLIRENKIAQMYSAIQTGRSVGMQTLDQNLTDLVRATSSRRLKRAPRPRSPTRTSRADHGLIPAGGLENCLGGTPAAVLPAATSTFLTGTSTARKRRKHGTRPGTKFINDLLRLMVSRNGQRPVHHRRLSAGHQGRRQDHQGVPQQPDPQHTWRWRARS